jgi:predicted CoA-binding protein
MASLKQIEDFLAAQPVAMAGVSRNPKKFGQMAFRELREKGLNIIPINPVATEVLGQKAYPDVKSLPGEVQGLIVLTKKDQTLSVVREAMARGIKNIWIQQSSESKEAVAELQGSDINLITGQCILMYQRPNGVHKFHRAIKKLFGSYPK